MDNFESFDWELYLLKILDGYSEAEISKIGSSSGFLQNKINSFDDPEVQRFKLINIIKKIADSKRFIASEALNSPPNHFDYICNWIVSFLSYEQTMIRKIVGLLVSLSQISTDSLSPDSLNRYNELVYSNNLSLFTVLKLKKKEFENQGVEIVEEYSLFKPLIHYWEANCLNPQNITTLFAIKGLIHFKQWHTLTVGLRRDIILMLKDDSGKELLRDILNDMAMTKVDSQVDYGLFADDCIRFGKRLISKYETIIMQWATVADVQASDNNKAIFGLILKEYSKSSTEYYRLLKTPNNEVIDLFNRKPPTAIDQSYSYSTFDTK